MNKLEQITIDLNIIEKNKFVYRRKINTGGIAFNDRIKTGLRQRILPAEGGLTIDTIVTFWSAYGSVKGGIAAKDPALGRSRFADLYALYVASSYADDTFSKHVENPLRYSGMFGLECNDEYTLISGAMESFLAETQNCNSGSTLARATRGFFQKIQELSRDTLNAKYSTQLEEFKKKYSVNMGNTHIADGTDVETKDPNEGKPSETVTFNDIGGYTNIVDEMRFLCDALKGEKYTRKGYEAPRGICFWGLPGTGKTLMAKAIACESGYPFYYFNVAEVLSKWVGESEKNLQTRLSRSGIHFLDEADSILGVQKDGADSGHNQRLINVYAEVVEGFNSNKNAIYILATNNPNLDPKVKRAGRIDEFHYFGLPELSAIYHILQIHAKKTRDRASEQIMDELDYTAIANAVYSKSVIANKKNPNLGMSPADCKNILKITHRRMLKNYWKTDAFTPMTTNDVLETVRDYNLEIRA